MKRVSAADAKARFDDVITLVKAGETVMVADEAQDILEIKPPQIAQPLTVDRDKLDRLKRAFSGVTIDDLLSAAHEGHRA
jgi:antitoxin (DNA-binding transcriptional repressor) of toxin-antitoxin stability system